MERLITLFRGVLRPSFKINDLPTENYMNTARMQYKSTKLYCTERYQWSPCRRVGLSKQEKTSLTTFIRLKYRFCYNKDTNNNLRYKYFI